MTTIVLYCNDCRKGMQLIEAKTLREINKAIKEFNKEHSKCAKKCKGK